MYLYMLYKYIWYMFTNIKLTKSNLVFQKDCKVDISLVWLIQKQFKINIFRIEKWLSQNIYGQLHF